MGSIPQPGGTACPACGAPLKTSGECLACLLSLGLDEPGAGVETGASTPSAPPAETTVYGDFEIVRREDASLWELGRGAMGVTYRAVDRVLQRPVALKVILAASGAVNNEMIRERFLREARAAAALRHANVAGVFQFGVSRESGRWYYAMELVEGETLEARVRRDGPMDAATTLEIARQVALALVAAGNRGLIHRDLKPSNLMLIGGTADAEMEVKVIDFGLAKVAATAAEMDLTHGGFVGTPAFASPEQFERAAVDARTDVYSLGVTLWFALTGKVPFTGRTVDELFDTVSRADLPVGQLTAKKTPASLVALLQAMLAVDPANRPASARELLVALQSCQSVFGSRFPVRRLLPAGRASKDHRLLAVLVFILLLFCAGVIWWEFRAPGTGHGHEPGPLIPEKSVAVLPFNNLSDDKSNAYFVGGIQDEILTNLAKVADLKVISRNSAQAFGPDNTRNLQEISRALAVAYVLKGSVQRDQGRVRVIAQLIDARTGTQIWANRYDRELADIFAIQSEVAESIVGSLRARLSPGEKNAIDTRLTADMVAYDLYLRAKELIATYPQTADWRATLLEAVRLLDEATTRDGNFALAYCLVARAHDDLHFTDLDMTPARLALQERATATALRLQPTLGEAHLARAFWFYHGLRDYSAARQELAIASAALPNNAEISQTTSFIDRREGRWDDAQSNQARALLLDPTNLDILSDQIVLYDTRRLYREEIHAIDLAAAKLPTSADFFRLMKAGAFLEVGQTHSVRVVLDTLPAGYDPNGSTTYARVCAALYDGRPAEAAAALAGYHGNEYPSPNGLMVPSAWLEALIARAADDGPRAAKAFLEARGAMATLVLQHPENALDLALLGLIDAALGHKEDALQEGRRAVEMRPISVDAMEGPNLVGMLAMTCAWTGDADAAMGHLRLLQNTPGGPDYGQLRYDPAWSSLRERPDFKAMLIRLEPKF